MSMATALAIFLATYVLLSLRRLFHIPLERPATALLGASAMVVFGVVTPERAIASIDVPTILLLIGMMLVVVVLEATGLFAVIAHRVVVHSRTPARLLVGVGVASALLSALVLNDAVVLFFTPILIHASRQLGTGPVKYLVTEAIGANLGSVATQVGNPQVAYIGLQSGIPFHAYALVMTPIMLACLALALALLLWLYRPELKTPFAVDHATLPPPPVTHPRLLGFGLVVVAALTAAFLASPWLGLPISLLALAGGSVMAFAAPVLGNASPRQLLRRVDWSIILLFVGLFVVLEGVTASGGLELVLEGLEATSAGAIHEAWGLGLVASVVSNLISNVPATILLAPLVAQLGDPGLWHALALATTFAGNATLVGAAANLIVAERAEEMGVPIRFWDFFRVGFPVTLGTLALGFLLLEVGIRWGRVA